MLQVHPVKFGPTPSRFPPACNNPSYQWLNSHPDEHAVVDLEQTQQLQDLLDLRVGGQTGVQQRGMGGLSRRGKEGHAFECDATHKDSLVAQLYLSLEGCSVTSE